MKIRGELAIMAKKSKDQELFAQAKQQHNFVVAQPDSNEINRQLIALQEEAERMFELSLNIDDLNNIDSKSTAFSKTIILPGTAKNNGLLGNIFDLNNSNFTYITIIK